MCMLTVIPSGIVPNCDGIFNGTVRNDDGHGYAIATPDKGMVWGRYMNADQAVSAFEAARKLNPEGPAIFHSRWATHGVIAKDNCHPFKVGGDGKTLLAHNGILPAQAQPTPSDRRSDTRKFAESILPHMGHLDNPETTQRIEKFMGMGNKIAIITVNPQYKDNLYLYNEDLGIWSEDVWYSNSDFRPYAPAKSSGVRIGQTFVDAFNELRQGPSDFWMGGDYDMCEVCYSTTHINRMSAKCEACNSCLECYQSVIECDCYTPSSAMSSSSYTFGKSWAID